MPQPLRSLPDDIKFDLDALNRRPELALRIARVSALWSEIEIGIGAALAVALHMQASVGVAMYLSLTGSASQEHVLTAAFKKLLTSDLSNDAELILADMRKRAKERNAVIHCLWGTSEKYPDKLINCPPDNLVRDLSDGLSTYLATSKAIGPSKEYIEKLRIYGREDFDAIESRINLLGGRIQKLSQEIGKMIQKRHALSLALLQPPASPSEPLRPDKTQTNPEEPER